MLGLALVTEGYINPKGSSNYAGDPENNGPNAPPMEANNADNEFIVDFSAGRTVWCIETNSDTNALNT
jgi:hypothetical protein